MFLSIEVSFPVSEQEKEGIGFFSENFNSELSRKPMDRSERNFGNISKIGSCLVRFDFKFREF